MPEPVLSCRGLAYAYPGGGAGALDDVALTVEAGELVVLCGPSGSGKTTLLRAACGLVPHFHGGSVSGELRVGGLDVREHGPAELAAAVGLVAQEPESQVVSTTVRSEVELPLELRGFGPAPRARAVEEVSLALGVADLLERTTDTLSGGELQRVALAAAMVGRPSLLLLDEPTSQLDPVAGDELIGLLRRVNEEWGVAVLLGEHRLERCLSAADRVVALEAGRVAFDGDPLPFLRWALERRPELATPAATMFSGAGLEPPVSVRAARRQLSAAGLGGLGQPLGPGAAPDSGGDGVERGRPGSRSPAAGAGAAAAPALGLRDVWVELGEGAAAIEALRGLDLVVAPGERLALMGRNGAGKSTLLRVAAGLLEPGRGRVEAPGGVALLPQRPGDMFVRERVGEELPGQAGRAALSLVGLDGIEDADPRDLSGGQRQRLALAIALAGRGAGAGSPPGAVLLDEPTRGMDRARKRELAALSAELAAAGAAVVIATHDVEFAAEFADRVVLMGRGELVADGPAQELLAGGWYFSTEVARVLSGAAVTPAGGARLLRTASAAAAEPAAPAAGGGAGAEPAAPAAAGGAGDPGLAAAPDAGGGAR